MVTSRTPALTDQHKSRKTGKRGSRPGGVLWSAAWFLKFVQIGPTRKVLMVSRHQQGCNQRSIISARTSALDVPHSTVLFAERFYDNLRCFASRKILLSSDEIAVAYSETAP